MLVEYVASDLSPAALTQAVNFALKAVVRLDVCKEAALKPGQVTLRLYEFPGEDLAAALEELGFRIVE